MYLDFEQLRQMGDKLHKAYNLRGDCSTQLSKGEYVYGISFEPSSGQVSAHVQWPLFRNLVKQYRNGYASGYRVQPNPDIDPWMHFTCNVRGVEICAVVYKQDILKELKSCGVGADFYEDEVDIEDLLELWQNYTGWNLDTWEEV